VSAGSMDAADEIGRMNEEEDAAGQMRMKDRKLDKEAKRRVDVCESRRNTARTRRNKGHAKVNGGK
jgi:hypothetical protein